jgi:hypothetical protein
MVSYTEVIWPSHSETLILPFWEQIPHCLRIALADNPPAIAGFRSGVLVSAKRGLPANEIAPHKCFVPEKSAPSVGAQSVISCLDRQYHLPIDGLGSPRQI